MKYCDNYAALLDLYVDGELSVEEMTQLQAHLDTCPGCRAYVDDALAIRAAFPDVEDTVVPDGFSEGIMATIRANAVPQPSKKRRWMNVLLPLAACCAIVVAVQNPPDFTNTTANDTASAPEANIAYGVEAYQEEGFLLDVPTATEARTTANEPSEQPETMSELADSENSTYTVLGESSNDSVASPSQAKQNLSGEETAPADLETSKRIQLVLTVEEVGDSLSHLIPILESETEWQYQLSAAEYLSLLDVLPPETRETAPEISEDFILIVVQK